MTNILQDIRAIKNPFIRIAIMLPVAAIIAIYMRGIINDNNKDKVAAERVGVLRTEYLKLQRKLEEHDSLCSDEKLKIVQFYNAEKERRIQRLDSLLEIANKKK